MPKYCPECGGTVKEGIKFCKSCGHDLKKTTETKTSAQPVTHTPPAPMPKKHCGFGVASLVLGIVSMSLIWMSLNGWLYALIELPMAIIATILGPIGYWGKWKDKYGLAGFILGLLVIIIGLILAVVISPIIFRPYYYYY